MNAVRPVLGRIGSKRRADQARLTPAADLAHAAPMSDARTTQAVTVDLDAIAANVRKAYPGTPSAVVETEVAEAARLYGDATVPDFLPVLIERRVRNRLRAGALAT